MVKWIVVRGKELLSYGAGFLEQEYLVAVDKILWIQCLEPTLSEKKKETFKQSYGDVCAEVVIALQGPSGAGSESGGLYGIAPERIALYLNEEDLKFLVSQFPPLGYLSTVEEALNRKNILQTS